MRIGSMFSALFDPWTWSGGLPVDADSAFRSVHRFGSSLEDYAVNPANGLPMIGGITGLDVAGNLFAMDHSHRDLDVTIPDFSLLSGLGGGVGNDWTSSSGGGSFD